MAQITLNASGVASNGALALQSNGTTTAVTINASQGVEFNAGTAAAPTITTTGDTNTGIFFPAADTIAFAEGGVESMRIDSSGNVGIGTASPNASYKMSITGNSASIYSGILFTDTNAGGGVFSIYGESAALKFRDSSAGATRMVIDSSGNVGIGNSSPSRKLEVTAAGDVYALVETTGTTGTVGYLFGDSTSDAVGRIEYVHSADVMTFTTASTERARIDSSGRLLLNSTTYNFNSSQIMNVGAGAIGVEGSASTSVYSLYIQNASGIGAVSPMIRFSNSNGITGSISSTVGTTTYATSSDYRLKENIAPMTGALGVVAQLNPVTYTWKADGSDGQGFIAHELQAVVPDAVVGEKDAVDENGNIKPQGIDTSFLVATLTAAIQEQQAIITSLTDRITALEQA